MDSNNLWTRRSQNSSKLSLATANGSPPFNDHAGRNFSSMRKGETSSHNNRNPFNSPALASPTVGASSAFGLGSGAFASFGSAKTPKTPGTALDFGSVLGGSTKTPVVEKSTKEVEAKLADVSVTETTKKTAQDFKKMTLRYTWVFWVRPPVHKSNGFVEYEKTVHEMVKVSNVNDYWVAFKHLKHPSTLPVVTDRHIFKHGIRPIWEDADNKKGGKWELRLKKGIADHYFDETQLALIGDWFDDSEEICGAVISVRNGEDILSMWLRDNDSHKNIKIRDQWKKFLNCPLNTAIEWKGHDKSLEARANLDQQRKEKNHNQQQTSTRNGEPSTSSDRKPAS